MKRVTQLVLLCEDEQHAVFMSRFIKRMGWRTSQLRIEKASRGKGSAEQFVREAYPRELMAYRRNRSRIGCMLAVMVDGDNQGVSARSNSLQAACINAGVPPRQAGDKVAVFVPTWNIETWLTYLVGTEVDERRSDYPKLARPRECQEQVNRLKVMCDGREMQEPVPPSLQIACEEFQSRLN